MKIFCLSLQKLAMTNGTAFSGFLKRVQHRIAMPKVPEISYPEFPFHLIFIPEFPEF